MCVNQGKLIRERLSYFQSEIFINKLIDKNIADAYLFIYQMLQDFRFAYITQAMIDDICNDVVVRRQKYIPLDENVTIFTRTYSVNELLTKLVKEWFGYMAQSLDELAQVLNSVFNIEEDINKVTFQGTKKKLDECGHRILANMMDVLFKKFLYINAFNNYSKHLSNIWVREPLTPDILSKKVIKIPTFSFKNEDYEEKLFQDVASKYQNILASVIDVLNEVRLQVDIMKPISNRKYVIAYELYDTKYIAPDNINEIRIYQDCHEEIRNYSKVTIIDNLFVYQQDDINRDVSLMRYVKEEKHPQKFQNMPGKCNNMQSYIIKVLDEKQKIIAELHPKQSNRFNSVPHFERFEYKTI